MRRATTARATLAARASRPRRAAAAAVTAAVAALAVLGCSDAPASRAPVVPGGDAERGAALLAAYGCGACHAIPGVRGADALVGPPLTGWAERRYIAGSLVNTPENLMRWIMTPQAIEPGTAMPDLGVGEAAARDMAAYLFTLRRGGLGPPSLFPAGARR
ncbi:MAG TPA: c-type cytochrome [Longimicrobiales bacterium]